MANPQMILIGSQTLGSSTASVTFSSIPQTYTDLKVVMSARSDSGAPGFVVSFNGSTTGFTYRNLEGSGSAATSSSGSTGTLLTVNPSTATASTFSNSEIYIPNYAGSNNKSFSGDGVTENNAAAAYTDLNANLWSNTSAISSITINCGATTFSTNSSFYLYGITRQ